MSDKAKMSTAEDESVITHRKRGIPVSDLKIPMPETKPPKPTSAEQTGTTSQNQADE